MDIIIPHYPNDSEHLQIQCMSPQAENEGWDQELQNSISTHWMLRATIEVQI